MKTSPDHSFVFDQFCETPESMKIFFDNFAVPYRCIYLKASKDQVEENIQKFTSDFKQKQAMLAQYEKYIH